MKRTIFLFSALLMFSLPARAQEDSKLHLTLNGGWSIPQQPDFFKDAWSNGFKVGGGLGYRLSSHFTVQGLVNYDRFPFDERVLDDPLFKPFFDPFGPDPFYPPVFRTIDFQGTELSVLSVSGELKVSFVGDPNKLSPYVIGGGGIARVSVGDRTFSRSGFGIDYERSIEGESDTQGMSTPPPRVDIPLGERVGVFVEGRYQFNFTEHERTDFASLRGGVRIGL